MARFYYPSEPQGNFSAIRSDILKLRWKCHGNSAVTWPTETSSHKSTNSQKKGVREFCILNFQSHSFHGKILC